MEQKEYMVFGIKGGMVADTATESDNPYIFYSLRRAFEVAAKIVAEEAGYARIVEISTVEIIDFTCKS